MKFDIHKPIVFALSSNIPERFREAVREGVLYWNKALGVPLIQVVDAPPGVGVPDPDYNVIQWVTMGNYGSTSHIQDNPLTGEILHAYIFIRAQAVAVQGGLSEQKDRLRYIVAHEVGHALGLRHNFAKGPVSTVMNYFDFKQSVEVGREIATSPQGLEYDRDVVRYVYLGEPLDVKMLPAFCTDNQPGCSPYKRGIMLGTRPAIHAHADVKRDGTAGG